MTTKYAVVHDWLAGGYAGAEKVLEQMLVALPSAPVYTTVYEPRDFIGTRLAGIDIKTSLIERLPWGRRKYKMYLPLMPYAVEQFDLTEYDVIVSSSCAVAKGVLVSAEQLHLSYVHSPVRYAWDLYQQYLQEANLTAGLKGLIAKSILHYIRLWDQATANRVDVFLANSQHVAKRIWRTYRRPARVVYPPVDVQRFDPTQKREDFYLTLSRLVSYKKVDLIVEACTRAGRPLVVIGDGPERAKIEAIAGSDVIFLGRQPDDVVADYMARCRAFIFAAHEDFGIVSLEAQAAGAPVIAYGRGGSLETVIRHQTGIFFEQQNVQSIIEAIQLFEEEYTFDSATIHAHALRFQPERFCTEFQSIVQAAQDARNYGQNPEQAVLALR